MKLKKIIINILCCFIPFKLKRKKFKSYFFNKNKIIFVKNGVEYKKRFYQRIKGIKFYLLGKNNIVKIDISSISNSYFLFFGIFFNKKNKIKFNNFYIDITGGGNSVYLKTPMEAISSCVSISSNNSSVELSDNISIHNTNIVCRLGENQFCKIGKKTTMWGSVIDVDDVSSCIIGEDCMFSNSIVFRCSDGHAIFEKGTKNIINRNTEPLTIGNHCWVGQGVVFTKNARLPNNSIVGMNSLVTKKFTEEYTAIAGNPAKVVKNNVEWDRMNITWFDSQNKKNIK